MTLPTHLYRRALQLLVWEMKGAVISNKETHLASDLALAERALAEAKQTDKDKGAAD